MKFGKLPNIYANDVVSRQTNYSYKFSKSLKSEHTRSSVSPVSHETAKHVRSTQLRN